MMVGCLTATVVSFLLLFWEGEAVKALREDRRRQAPLGQLLGRGGLGQGPAPLLSGIESINGKEMVPETSQFFLGPETKGPGLQSNLRAHFGAARGDDVGGVVEDSQQEQGVGEAHEETHFDGGGGGESGESKYGAAKTGETSEDNGYENGASKHANDIFDESAGVSSSDSGDVDNNHGDELDSNTDESRNIHSDIDSGMGSDETRNDDTTENQDRNNKSNGQDPDKDGIDNNSDEDRPSGYHDDDDESSENGIRNGRESNSYDNSDSGDAEVNSHEVNEDSVDSDDGEHSNNYRSDIDDATNRFQRAEESGPVVDGSVHQSEIDLKCKACDQCGANAKGGVEEKESQCSNECTAPEAGLNPQQLSSKVVDGIEPKQKTSQGCPELELSVPCIKKFLPDQYIIGASLGFNRIGGGLDMVVDLDTFEIGFFGYGAFTVLGTNLVDFSGNANFYAAFGWKGVDKGQKVESQYSGWGFTADLSIGGNAVFAKADLTIAMGVAAEIKVSETATCTKGGNPPQILSPRWDAGKTVAVGAGVGIGLDLLPLPIDVGANIGIAHQSALFSVSPLQCKSKAPYCMAALLFVLPPVVPIFQKILAMTSFMDKWCPMPEAEGSFLCQSSKKLPEPTENGSSGVAASGGSGQKAWTWEAVLAVWAEKGAHLIKLLKKAFTAGKMTVEALTKGLDKAKALIAKAVKTYVGNAMDEVRELFGDVDPDQLAIERVGLPEGHEKDGGVYVKIKDCDGDNFEDDSWVLPVERFERPYFECVPVGQHCGADGDDCNSVETRAAYRGGKKPDEAHESFQVAPDPHRFYWDYAKDDWKAGWGRIWRGQNMDKCVKCMLRERRRNMLDADFDDTFFKVCGGPGEDIPKTQRVRVVGDVVKGAAYCNVVWKWCPGNNGKCLM